MIIKILAAVFAGFTFFTAQASQPEVEDTIYVKLSNLDRYNATPSTVLEEATRLLPLAGSLQVQRVFLGDWVVVKALGVQTQADVQALGGRIQSLPGVGKVDYPKQKRLHEVTAATFNDPGWETQFITMSGRGSSATRAGRSVSPQFDLVLDAYAGISSNLRLAILDEGYNRSVDFDGRVLSERDYGKLDGEGNPTLDATPDGESCEFDPGLHGAHVASVMGAAANNEFGALGLAPEAQFHMIRIFNCSGNFNFTGYGDAIQYLAALPAETRPLVINMSFGDFVGFGGDYPPCSGIEQDIINVGVEAGIFMVASAGNEGAIASGNNLPAPASCDGVISVGAVDNGGRYTSYSTVAPTLDISTFGGGTSDDLSDEQFIVTDVNVDGNVSGTQGTSFSSPAAATVLAYARHLNPSLDAPTAISTMQATAYKATPETDARCAGDNCFSLKAANFLATIAGTPLPGPVESDPSGDNAEDPAPPEPPAPPAQPNSLTVAASAFGPGFDDICSVTLRGNGNVMIEVGSLSERCSNSNATSRVGSQEVTVQAEVGTTFTAEVDGYRVGDTGRATLYGTFELGEASVTLIGENTPAQGEQITARVEAGNFAGGYDDICSVTVTDNSAVTVTIQGGSARCGTVVTNSARTTHNSGQIVVVQGPNGANFNATITGFTTGSGSQSTQTKSLSLAPNSVSPQSTSPSAPQNSPSSAGGGGGGSAGGLLGLLGLFGLLLTRRACWRRQ